MLMPDGGTGKPFFVIPLLRTTDWRKNAAYRRAAPGKGWHGRTPLAVSLVTETGFSASGTFQPARLRKDDGLNINGGDLDGPFLMCRFAAGYTLRALGLVLELLGDVMPSGLGFHQGDIKVALRTG